ncbi:Holliday junction resolvase RuvX [Succinispira mobilis]|uniref:Holliday junction resolvase RuvX n=1 Tax=Succinispira mobilis TaxID=78120 RepID=UPI0003706D74
MKIMALDVGDRTIGIAISDATKMIAQGIEVIRRVGNVKDLARLAELISEYDVSEIVVGYPKNMNGSIGERCVIVEKFTELLKNAFPQIKYHYWDERLSTMEAQKILISSDVRRDKRKKVIDKMAAVIILQGYLDRQL